MFKKALAHQSNATPIRSSARRQVVSGLFAQYPGLRAAVAADAGANPDGTSDAGGEGKLSEKELGKILVPDGVRSANFETSGGVDGMWYVGPDGDPLWMSFGRGSKELAPTLCLLARLPAGVHPFPVLMLPHPLPPPLLTGAPLFLPAVRHLGEPWKLPDVGAGDIVAFAAPLSDDSSSLSYVAVGRVVAQGGLAGALERWLKHRAEGVERDEGKFADILCIMDDHLWDMGSKPHLQTFPLPAPAKPLVEPPEDKRDATDGVGELTGGIGGMDISGNGQAGDAAVDSTEPLTPAEVSTLLSAALLQTLVTLPSGTLPLPASQLYSAHILPNRPAYIPSARRDDVVISKSEWKKLAKWMKEAAKEGIIKTKETKGEVVVTSFDAKHPAVDGHVTFTTVSEDEAKAAKRAAREAAAAEPASSTQMDIQELWRPSGSAVDFWAACGIDKASLNQPNTIRPLLDGYVAKHGLEDKEQRRVVELDKTLAAAIGGKPGQFLVRDEVTRRLRSGVAWSVSVGGTVKKGTLNPISMVVKTRQGRKQVTLVSGLEAFGINIDDFAEELRRLCAGSTSIQPLTGASPKLNLKEVLVQGSQCKAVTEALVARGVPKRWIKEESGDKKKR